MVKLKQGWGFPLNIRKAHFFTEGEIISICGRLMFAGERFDDKHDSPDNCAKCKRLRAGLIAQGKITG
jgi:hypothetical protein